MSRSARVFASVTVATAFIAATVSVHAQSLSIRDRIAWEEAAWIAFEAREYERAQAYIMGVLETEDSEYRESDQYESAFRLAAEIQRALRPLLASRVNATPLPFSDSLARTGFSHELRDRSGDCEWRRRDAGTSS